MMAKTEHLCYNARSSQETRWLVEEVQGDEMRRIVDPQIRGSIGPTDGVFDISQKTGKE